jgi:hypothetical protein
MLIGRGWLVWISLAVAAPVCLAQHPIPESERWATITYPGNEPYLLDVGTGTPAGGAGNKTLCPCHRFAVFGESVRQALGTNHQRNVNRQHVEFP